MINESTSKVTLNGCDSSHNNSPPFDLCPYFGLMSAFENKDLNNKVLSQDTTWMCTLSLTQLERGLYYVLAGTSITL